MPGCAPIIKSTWKAFILRSILCIEISKFEIGVFYFETAPLAAMAIETRSMKRAALRRADLNPNMIAAIHAATSTTANTVLTAPQRRATAAKVARGKFAIEGKVSAHKVQKGARAKKGGTTKGGNSANKVQRNTATKKPRDQTAKPKTRGKKAAEEDEVKNEKLRPGRESGLELKPSEGRGKGKPTKASNKVQKSVETRSQPAGNVKQKVEGGEAADENAVEGQEPESEREQHNELAQIVNKWKKKPRVSKSTKPKKGGINAISKAKKEAKANEVINASKPKKQNPISERAMKK